MSGSEWIRVAPRDDLPTGGARMVKAGPRLLALVRTDAGYGALDNRCPHLGAPLGQGMVEDGRLVCPWHGRAYDPTTGECDGYAEYALAFPVEEREDGVYVFIPMHD